jgi:GAF domain-containing protein
MSRLNSALRITRDSEQAQIKANQELRELQVTLEQRVAERTAAAESARTEAENARKDLEVQFWLATGQMQLMDAVRGEQTILELADNVIAHLCRYINAQAGALFLLEEMKLKLIGAYAYTTSPGFDGAFALGEGLVGQVAVDGKLIYQDVPSDSLVISTGLAEFKPRQIAAAPFYMNGKVVGVLELATISEFTANHLEFWKRVSETLGAAFHTIQTRQAMAELLAESQKQAEELQAQEEELRAANEELQAQAENLKAVRALAQKDDA